LCPIEGFFELHPPEADGRKERQKAGAKGQFFSQLEKV
jgi:hypothetical protein